MHFLENPAVSCRRKQNLKGFTGKQISPPRQGKTSTQSARRRSSVERCSQEGRGGRYGWGRWVWCGPKCCGSVRYGRGRFDTMLGESIVETAMINVHLCLFVVMCRCIFGYTMCILVHAYVCIFVDVLWCLCVGVYM